MTDPAPNRARAILVKIDPDGQPTRIPFQYNLDTLRRSLQPATVGGQPGGHSKTVRFSGAPSEIITLIIELGALDDLPTPARNTAAGPTGGVYPLLQALEALIYPLSAQSQQAAQMLSSGAMEIAPILAPTVLFVWGGKRVVPVTVQSIEVLEQAFDAQLSPLRAVVSLTLCVLTYSDIDPSSAIYGHYIEYQQGKEMPGAEGHAT